MQQRPSLHAAVSLLRSSRWLAQTIVFSSPTALTLHFMKFSSCGPGAAIAIFRSSIIRLLDRVYAPGFSAYVCFAWEKLTLTFRQRVSPSYLKLPRKPALACAL